MSRNIQKFCKVCQDAGKSEVDYRSHFTRETADPHSKVVCPLLLSLECRFCFKNGHTVKYCPKLKQQDKTLKYAQANKQKQIEHKLEIKQVAKKPSANLFICLDSDSEEESDPRIECEFPCLVKHSNASRQPEPFSYAAALAKKPVVKELALYETTKIDAKPPVTTPVTAPVTPTHTPTATATSAKLAPWTQQTSKTSKWAALESDEEEDDEDEYEEEYVGFNKCMDDDDTW